MKQFEQTDIRNFCIISHVNHGKSTLADRFLELTGTVSKEKMRPQYLDMMDLEREKGITIKMQPVRMIYKVNHTEIRNTKSEILNKFKIQNSKFQKDNLGFSASDLEFAGSEFILNLIDTPGHVDFSYEVSRSLAAVEGVVLLVDASKGVQAQTLANLELAKKQNLVVIPVVNKIDLPQARIEEATEELANLLKISNSEIIKVSAKLGTNAEQVLKEIIEKIPPPKGSENNPLRALIFDSEYDSYKGVIAYVKIVDGKIKSGDSIYLLQAQTKGEAKEIGYFIPQPFPKTEITTGEIGYIATGIKEAGRVRVGDTITKISNLLDAKRTPRRVAFQISNLEPLAGYKEPQSMVFTSFYPENPDDFELLKESLNKLKLNDASLTYELETQESIGRGFRCGFLGTLHAEIISERLRREFGLDVVMSAPQVLCKVINKQGEEKLIFSANKWPNPSEIKEAQEPWAKLEIISPLKYFGPVGEILSRTGGNFIERKYFSADRVFLIYEVPLREILVGFYDNLKGVSQGFASMNYEILGFRPTELVKLEILIAGEKKEAFSRIVPERDASGEGRKIVVKLKEILPPQLFSVSLQAAVSGRIVARETITAKRRDVTSSLYGGDYTRKKKLLERQKRGKKELSEKGRVRIPTNVFLEMIKT